MFEMRTSQGLFIAHDFLDQERHENHAHQKISVIKIVIKGYRHILQVERFSSESCLS
jgi:hypothetical protein